MECCKWSIQNQLIVHKTGPERLQLVWTGRTKIEINSRRYSVVTWRQHSVFFTRKTILPLNFPVLGLGLATSLVIRVDIFRWRKCILTAMRAVMSFQCVMTDVSTVPNAAVGATSSEGFLPHRRMSPKSSLRDLFSYDASLLFNLNRK